MSINQWKYIAHRAQPCLKRLTGVTLIVCQSLLHKDAHHISSLSLTDRIVIEIVNIPEAKAAFLDTIMYLA